MSAYVFRGVLLEGLAELTRGFTPRTAAAR